MSSLSSKQGPRYRHTADGGEPYETIAVEKLTPIIGAEITGVDLGKLVSDDARSNRQIDSRRNERNVLQCAEQRMTLAGANLFTSPSFRELAQTAVFTHERLHVRECSPD